MKILFGKPKLEYCKLNADGSFGAWTQLPTPKEDSTSLETNEGTDLEAREEGGEVVDRIGQASSYALSFELFKKKNEAFPMSEDESRGIVSGEYAIRVTSAIDDEAPGYQIDRASVKTARLYSTGDTYRKQYTFSALKPTSGDTVKDIENTTVDVAYSASASSKTVTLVESGMTVGSKPDWVTTATVSGTTLSLSISTNSGSTTRTGFVEVNGKGTVQIVKLVCAPSA